MARRALAAAPLAFASLLYLYPLVSDGRLLPLTDQESLGYAMQVEFIALMTGFFLIIFILFIPKTLPGKIMQALYVIAVVFGFSKVTYESMGFESVVYLVLLVYLTYGGTSLLQRRELTRLCMIFITFARWLMAMVLLPPLMLVFDMPEAVENWYRDDNVLKLGASYFGLLALLEFFLYAWLAWKSQTWMEGYMAGHNVNDDRENPNYLKRRAFYRKLYRSDR